MDRARLGAAEARSCRTWRVHQASRHAGTLRPERPRSVTDDSLRLRSQTRTPQSRHAPFDTVLPFNCTSGLDRHESILRGGVDAGARNRVWEANRKVFVYPENYIEPDLRNNKSHLFKELEEESLRDNFTIVYELLDEMMDFGYPQISEAKVLQE